MRNGLAPAMASLALAWAAPWSPTLAACDGARAATPHYAHRAMDVAARLGAAPGYALAHRWTLQPQASTLVHAGQDVYGRPLRLAPRAAGALLAMVEAAARDGVALQAVSGYRSFRYQRRLLRRKLDRGTPLASVLKVNALPGFSEHHSGCALDLTTPGVPAADAAFAATPAFAWLARHAGRFGFVLSYPQDNAQGVAFEPWHWRYDEAQVARQAAPSARGGGTPVRSTVPERARDATALADVSAQEHPAVQGTP